jgi:hypothetical protein
VFIYRSDRKICVAFTVEQKIEIIQKLQEGISPKSITVILCKKKDSPGGKVLIT